METDPEAEYGEECGHTSDEITTGRQAKEEEWQAAWYDGDCKDANRDTTKWLKDHVDELTGGKPGRRILVPLCGAVRDMHWLLNQGHSVVGIELVDKALRMFLDRHGIEYDVSDVPSVKDGKCYKSKDGHLLLYRCNIFDMDMSLVGKVDGVWDSGAMTDIPPAERVQYGEILLSALSPGGRILAETFTFGEIKDAKENPETGRDLSDGVCKYGVDHSKDPRRDDEDDDQGPDDDHDHGCVHGVGGSGCCGQQSQGKGEEEDYDFPCRPVEMRDFERMYRRCCSIELLEERDSQEYGCEEWGPGWWAKDRLHLVIVRDEETVGEREEDGSRKRGAEEGPPEGASITKKTKDETDN